MSLFDEIRYSFCNLSRHSNTGHSFTYDKNFDYPYTTVGTQTHETKSCENTDEAQFTTTNTSQTQTDELEPVNNNYIHAKCLECEKTNRYSEQLERDVNVSHRKLTEMKVELQSYEVNLDLLEKFVADGNERNGVLQSVIKSLEEKISILEVACAKQADRLDTLDSLTPDTYACTQTQLGMLLRVLSGIFFL